MNATFRMWVNRWNRLMNAWSDPESRGGKPKLTCVKVYSFAIALNIFLWLQQLVSIIRTDDIVNGWWEFARFFATMCALYAIAFKLSFAYLEYFRDEDEAQPIFWTTTIVSGLIGGLILGVCISAAGSSKPVSQKIYDSFKNGDPSCARYNDFRVDRINKGMVLTVKDLLWAKQECEETNERNLTLEKQRAIK